MSDAGPPDDPFKGIPLFGDLARMLQSQAGLNWEAARQFAIAVATGGQPEPNVDPLERIRFDEISRIAELHVADVTGLAVTSSGRGLTVVPVTRSHWAATSLDAYRPLLERLAGALAHDEADDADAGEAGGGGEPDAGDPEMAMWRGLLKLVSPMMLGLTAGSMIGHLAQRAFGQYDLPIPRAGTDTLLVVPANLNAFADDWSLPPDDLRMWTCVQEIATHAVLGVPHVRDELTRLIGEYVSGFRPDSRALEERFESMSMDDPASLSPTGMQQLFSDPQLLLGAMTSSEQQRLLPRLDALVAVIVGYVDHAVDTVTARVIGATNRIGEARRRHRVEAGPSDRFVERLLGLRLDQPAYDRGRAFVNGVLERAPASLDRLWHSPRELPTPAELDAPGLWLARIEISD